MLPSRDSGPKVLPVDYSAIVVGAGPAGSAAAILLSRLGWRVGLVERGPRHRPKACGQCLQPRAERVLDSLGVLEDVRRTAAGTTRQLRVHTAGRPSITAALGARDGLLVDRGLFDQLLVDHAAAAGAVVLQPAHARLRGLDAGGAGVLGHVEIETPRGARTVSCGLVVGADGLRSRVALDAGCATRPSGRRKFGWALRLSVPKRRADAVARGAIEMFVVPGGYLGVVRHGPEVLHVAGLCSTPASPWEMIERAAGRFAPLREAGLDLAREARRGKLLGAGPMPWRPRRVAVSAVALVGDAAGYAEPFTGEGMSWALESASVLASVAAGSPAGAWPSRLAARYRRAWSARIGRKQLLCRLLGAVLQRPCLERAAFCLARRGGVAAYLAGRIAAP